MPLSECLKKHTHREYRTWMAWLEEQWDNPSRTDQYLMQIACEVRRKLAKNPGQVKLEHFRLRFKREAPKPKTKDQVTEESKGFFTALVGGAKNIIFKTKPRED